MWRWQTAARWAPSLGAATAHGRGSQPGAVALAPTIPESKTMPELTYREALNQAMAEEMERDESVFLIGEEVGQYDGAYKVSRGLLARFGPKRVVDTPISELGFAGIGVGAAMVGMRPIVEFMTFNFAILALDQVLNSAAKMLYMSGGQIHVPIVFRGPSGAALQLAAQHSQALEAQYAHFPGLKVVTPATPADAKGLLKAAVRDDDPVVVLEGELLYPMKGQVPQGEHIVPLGVADLKREGTDVSIITHGKMVHVALQAATRLEKEEVSAEVLDLRSLRPLDVDAILATVRKTNRAVYVEEGWPLAGIGAQIVDIIQEEAFDHLDAPVLRVTQADVPMPYAKNLEQLAKPNVDRVIAACNKALYR
ncbi:MAG: pyruvate dehydrogenase complex E1 component subunit beta [Gemmatimonadetes bacterium]|nr:pyruvate dehydrogenase complex E1 component subunit beta [Gemmatimonadota bacterium]